MSFTIAPLTIVLFFIASLVLTGFTLYAHKAGKIKAIYTSVAGALLGLIFALLVALFTSNLLMATAVGIVIFGWFLAFSRTPKQVKPIFGYKEGQN